MVDIEQPQPSLCQRICCCMTTPSKEPPVQLIRTGALPVTPVINGHISAAEHTIDELEDVALERRLSVSTDESKPSKPRDPLVVQEPQRSDFAMNDIMLEEILGEEKHDDVEGVVEDAISISTNVVEEVDESELSRLRLHPTVSGSPASEENRSNAQNGHAPSESEEEEEDEESAEKVEISVSMEMPSTSKETSDDKAKVDSEDESRTSPASSIDEDGSVSEEDGAYKNTSDRNPSPDVSESLAKDSGPSVVQVGNGSDIEEEIMMTSAPPPEPPVQKAFDPPSLHPKSIMYADTSSEEESDDDEANREVMPPVQRSQRIMNIDQLRTDQRPNGRLDSESSSMDGSATNPFESSDSDDNRVISDVVTKIMDEDNAAVTRIVVRDDGRSEVLSSGGVKLNLDGRDVLTDEEFSEKLI